MLWDLNTKSGDLNLFSFGKKLQVRLNKRIGKKRGRKPKKRRFPKKQSVWESKDKDFLTVERETPKDLILRFDKLGFEKKEREQTKEDKGGKKVSHFEREVAEYQLFRGVLREYQKMGLDWLNTLSAKRISCILADEMGLGKTVQTIAHLAHLAEKVGVWGPHLIIVPTTVLGKPPKLYTLHALNKNHSKYSHSNFQIYTKPRIIIFITCFSHTNITNKSLYV